MLPRTGSGIDFLSNDYLGLASSKDIYKKVSDSTPLAALAGGKINGSSGSRLLSGNNPYFEELEKKVALFFKSQSALLFNSGFNLNIGLLSNLAREGDVLLLDQHIHASLKWGAKLSQASTYFFEHNNLAHLEKRLQSLRQKKDGLFFVVTEGLFSMDGDMPDFMTMAGLCKKYGAHLIVDEAHSGGLYGENGEGVIAQLGLENQVLCRMVTFGKAFGSFGSALLAPDYVKQSMINFCPSFIYTTSLPMNVLLTTTMALEYRRDSSKEAKLLFDNCKYYADQMEMPFVGPIFAHRLGSLKKIRECAEKCKDKGLRVLPIMSPTVQRGKEQIRVCLHSYNTQREMDELIHILRGYL